MNALSVNIGAHSYSIFCDEKDWKKNIPAELHGRKAIIICDENSAQFCLDISRNRLSGIFSGLEVVITKAGEGAKSLKNFENIAEEILAKNINRKTVLIALGGGVVGDLTGFLAATLLRGLPFIQIPTTLLAAVDSSVGGKTGVNARAGKNLIGAFYQPRAVLIETEFLKTLPLREMRAGYAEILKYGLLGDKEFYEELLNRGAEFFEDSLFQKKCILKSCAMKADIVAQDEFETKDVRALLNLGHTFAHAIEAACGYDGRVLHGEAVAIGLLYEAELSKRLGYIEEKDVQTLKTHLKKCGFIINPKEISNFTASNQELIDFMRKDKKAEDHRFVFVLLQKIGKANVERGVTEDNIQEVLEWIYSV